VKRVELYQKVRRAIIIDGMSRRAAAAYFGINRKTFDKMLLYPIFATWTYFKHQLVISYDRLWFTATALLTLSLCA
jgi:hypothetical protein